jgi:hypothetical protein
MFGNDKQTRVEIDGEKFRIDDEYTYAGQTYEGSEIEGLLFNSRMIQALFDDDNPETVDRWTYPDTGEWDPERNVHEFVGALATYYHHGLRAVTVNLQCGSPEGYSDEQPWIVSAYREDGSLKSAWMHRLERVLDAADRLGMIVILGLFYFGNDDHLADEEAVLTGVENAIDWLLEREYTNVLVEANNECDVPAYDHEILEPHRIHEVIEVIGDRERNGFSYPVGTSFGGGSVPTDDVVEASDFVLMHGNGVEDPERIGEMVREVRERPAYEPMPVLFNEDDHFDFYDPPSNMSTAIENYASWGYFDPGENNYRDGYQCPPTNWGINTDRKQEFFRYLDEVTSGD